MITSIKWMYHAYSMVDGVVVYVWCNEVLFVVNVTTDDWCGQMPFGRHRPFEVRQEDGAGPWRARWWRLTDHYSAGAH